MRTVRTAAFTLVELLVVIAIIGILFGFVAVAVPRVLERAKIAKTTATANQIRTVLSTYYTDFASYPPRYGYVMGRRGNVPEYFLRPYLHQVGIYSIEDYEDPFSDGVNTDGPFGLANVNLVGDPSPLGMLEFFPVGFLTGPNQREYPSDLFLGFNGDSASQDGERQLAEGNRTFVYLPVQQQQFDRVKAYYEKNPGAMSGDKAFARVWDTSDPRLEPFANPLSFPPPRYDAFVLLSVGPGGETGGILVNPIGVEDPEVIYHILGLRAYYLATRDLDANGVKDFDFIARSRQAEASNPTIESFGQNFTLLPDAYEQFVNGNPAPPRRYGPMIFAY